MALSKIGTDGIDTAATPTVASATVTGDLTVDTNTLYVDSTNNLVGVGTVSPETSIHAAKSNSGAMGAELTLDNPSTSAVSNATGINFLNDSGASASGVANVRIRSVTNNASTGAADIQFHTWDGSAEAERMRIYSSGIVTKPYQPSFEAYRGGGGLNIGSIASFSGNSTFHNVGGHYSTSTYRFTCPVGGLYHFYFWTIQNDMSTGTIQIRINGSTAAYGHCSTYGPDWGTSHITATRVVTANDYVEAYWANTQGQFHATPYSAFGGYLVG
jgi:hypothetical protein